MIDALQKLSSPDEATKGETITQQLLAYRALANALVALGSLHR
jgi:hypothetical protein